MSSDLHPETKRYANGAVISFLRYLRPWVTTCHICESPLEKYAGRVVSALGYTGQLAVCNTDACLETAVVEVVLKGKISADS